MSSIRSRDTKPEALLAVLIGEMFPRHKKISHAALPGKPDMYLPGLRLAVFADGCFWHGCPRHGRNPEDNSDYWGPKLERNKRRDKQMTREIRQLGLVAVRLWEHEIKEGSPARRKIRRALKTRKG